MSQREELEILLDIGEDFSVQIFWTDEDGQAVPVTVPARMDVRDVKGQLVLQFDSGNAGTPTTKAAVSVTGASGLIQLSAPKTVTIGLQAGRYLCDLWAVSTALAQPFPTQLQKVCSGWLIASPRVTNTEAAAV